MALAAGGGKKGPKIEAGRGADRGRPAMTRSAGAPADLPGIACGGRLASWRVVRFPVRVVRFPVNEPGSPGHFDINPEPGTRGSGIGPRGSDLGDRGSVP